MDNVFITQYFDWDRPESPRARLLTRLLRLVGYHARLVVRRGTGAMSTVEQRMNMYHLLSGVLVFGVPGDVVEVGCHTGSSAALFETVLRDHAAARRLHLYDAFLESPPEAVAANFARYGLRPPVIHAGLAEHTLPAELPGQICFAHVDVGPGRSPADMAATLRLSLEAIYPRMPAGAVCLMMDYCDPDVYRRPGFRFPSCIRFTDEWNIHPVVKCVCDAFLADKPEAMCALYAGDLSHGFFRKR